jgi:hypothetical protein
MSSLSCVVRNVNIWHVPRDSSHITQNNTAHQLAEDYMVLVSRIMGTGTSRTPSQQPHLVMARTPVVTSILELWNPREIALFEAAIYLHGKQFHKVQPFIKTKTTKQVVAFYYVWKKTLHYQEWKRQYTSSDSSSDSEQENT